MSGSLSRNAYQNYLSCLFIAADFYPSSCVVLDVCVWKIDNRGKSEGNEGKRRRRRKAGVWISQFWCQVV